MVTEAEELQTKEFLKRAEVRTMKKDLQALREVDALKERYKIIKTKTPEEQKAEQAKKKLAAEKELTQQLEEKSGREGILQKRALDEREAEKNLKIYAEEGEKQQIFLLESQRIDLEKQVKTIEQEKDPNLKLIKNRALLERRDWEAKLNLIKENNRKLDTEENFLNEKSKTSNIPSEKKSLEERRYEIEGQRKITEKKVWEVEKQLEAIKNKIEQTDKSSEQLVVEKNSLKDRVSSIDTSLRDIYSTIITRVEETRSGQAKEQKLAREAAATIRLGEKETIQRQQRTHTAEPPKKIELLKRTVAPMEEKLAKTTQAEEEQRRKFIKDIDNWAEKKDNGLQQQKSVDLPPPPKKI